MEIMAGESDEDRGQEPTKRKGEIQAQFRCGIAQAEVRHTRRSFVFLRKEQGTATEPKHKLAQVAKGPYAVKQSDSNTVVIAIGDQEERVSRDRVELAPSPMDHAPTSGLHQALQYLREPETTQERDAMESEDVPHTRTQRLEDDENLVSPDSSAEIPPDLQRSSNSEEAEESNDLQEGEEGSGAREPEDENAEYVIEKIIDHGYQDEELILKVKWFSYGTKDTTREPVAQLPRSAVVRYFRKKKLPLPPQVARALPGRSCQEEFGSPRRRRRQKFERGKVRVRRTRRANGRVPSEKGADGRRVTAFSDKALSHLANTHTTSTDAHEVKIGVCNPLSWDAI